MIIYGFSIDPDDLKLLVESIRITEKALESRTKNPTRSEKESRLLGRRSIVAKVGIPKGKKISEEMITFKRPGTGIYPKYKDKVVGKIAKVDIKKDEMITWDKI